VVIAAGGTTGHVAPALAVAQALRASGAEVSFIGGDRAEATLVPEAGFPLYPLKLEGLSRTNPARGARAVWRAGAASVGARRLLARLRPDVVMGGGGYVAGPVGLAALTMRVPLVLTEADSHLGLANRLLAGRASRICLAFPIAGRDGPNYRVTGRPLAFPGGPRAEARARFAIPPDADCVLVFGGSLGARSVNTAALEAFADAPWHVLHLTGARDYPEFASRPLREGYDLREQLDLRAFAWALSAADLVVARSGSSVLEIAAHGLPAVLVPYPHATAGHQLLNARYMEAAGAAVVVADDRITGPWLAEEVAELFGDRARMASMAAAARALAHPHAAEEVARTIMESCR
jgi:UDP-N-acetylglucosamine--N-acetylmuramyl-(pentapeptide) pyrophosphoryl-undecaprenol N-acetylglucosamine transferase